MTLLNEADRQPTNTLKRTRKQRTLYVPGKTYPNAVRFDKLSKKRVCWCSQNA